MRALVLWQMGDVLHAVDGKNVIGMNKMEVANLLMGPEGSKVRLRFLRQEGNGSCYKGGRGIGVPVGILPLMHLHFQIKTQPFLPPFMLCDHAHAHGHAHVNGVCAWACSCAWCYMPPNDWRTCCCRLHSGAAAFRGHLK